jgi:hypothetical protein
MIMPQAAGARLAALIGIASAAIFMPTAAPAATVTLLCGLDTSFGEGAETTYPRRNESRVLIDLKRGTVRFTSPGSGQLLVPNNASISAKFIRWTMGKPEGVLMSYSIDRASTTYTVRFTMFGTAQQGGSRGSCLPKAPF